MNELKKDIQDIVEIGNRICEKIDLISCQDNVFNLHLAHYLEVLSFDVYKTINDLKNIGGKL